MPAGLMRLAEDDVLLRAVQRPPGADAPLQRAADAGAELGMAAEDLLEDGDRPQAGRAFSIGTTSVSNSRPADRVVGGRAGPSSSTAGGDPAPGDRRWRC